jgi:hypothetical protein
LSSDFGADAQRPVDRADGGSGQSIEPTAETNAAVMQANFRCAQLSETSIFFPESLDAHISIFSASKIQQKFSVETQQ